MDRQAHYGAVGNGETVALIDRYGSLAWLCAPRFDSAPVFASALDPRRGGSQSFLLDRELEPLAQTYLGQSNVLQTVLKSGSLLMTIQDFMPWGKSFLTRCISLENKGSLAIAPGMSILVAPVSTSMYQLSLYDHEGFFLILGSGLAVCVGATGFPAYNRHIPLGAMAPGERREFTLAIGYGRTESEAYQAWSSGLHEGPGETLAFWRNWLAHARQPQFLEPDLQEAYYRSLLVLKLLTHRETGAILAAPTASFPAVPGGSDNWDYRYCWLRDGYYTALAFDQAGFFEEAEKFYEFAFKLQEDEGNWRQPVYTFDGRDPEEFVNSDLEGPRSEKPIRFGNLASRQLQLDNTGNIIHGLWFHYQATGEKLYLWHYWDNVRRACRWLERHWHRPEQGIWEIRERMDHWVHGKAMCYAALTAGSAIARELGYMGWAGYWLDLAILVRDTLVRNGWSEQRQAYLQHFGNDAPLDASVLALEFYGLLEPTDARLQATVARFEQPAIATGQLTGEPGLNMWGGIARHEYAVLPFYLPTLWLARYYLHTGNLERAQDLCRVCLDSSTDLWLMAEHFDPRGPGGKQWGNFPQAFSHEELIRYALELEDIRKQKNKPV